VPQNSLVDLLSLGRASMGSNLEQLLPQSLDFRNTLLDVYFANVDPMVRITHKSTVLRKFSSYNRETHPMAFAIYFSAINSLPPKVVQGKFLESKEALLNRFQLGVEISLARENYLTSSSLEIFQGFVLWLTCITREEDMGKRDEEPDGTVLMIMIRQSMGAFGPCFPDRLEPGTPSRSFIISSGIDGLNCDRVASTHVASARAPRVPRR
jgi:hypothetical protein